jgi:hypothetical protein
MIPASYGSCITPPPPDSALGDAGDVEVPSFQRRIKCAKCGGKAHGVRPELERADSDADAFRYD